MELNQFLAHIAAQFDDLDVSSLSVNTRFKEHEDYTSLVALCIITTIDEEYNVTISGDDMVKVDTIGELYDLVSARKNV
jgi:acyl carrier protein